MEKSKFYLVSARQSFSYSFSAPFEVYFNKTDADWRAWYLNKKQSGELLTTYFSVGEVDIGTTDNDPKLYKDFIKERLEEIEKEIKRKSECSDGDQKEIEKLQREKKYYLKK